MVNGRDIQGGIVTSIVMVLLGSGCGGPVCQRNSECETGNYCSSGTCAQDCTPETVEDDCAPGASCNSFGMCVGGSTDAGPDEDARGEADAGVDAPEAPDDAGADCVVAGGTDDDGDGFCVEPGESPDCDDTNAVAHPGADEVCTPSEAGSTPADESCDGGIDEGCEWHFGVAHIVPAVLQGFVPVTRINPNGSFLVGDGRLYVEFSPVALGGSNIVVFTREGRDAAFGAPSTVAFEATFAPIEFALLPDELSGVGSGGPTPADRDLYELRRATTSTPFTATRIDGLSTAAREAHTTLSSDGLELFFLRDSVLHRSTRATAAAAFTTAAIVEGMPSPMSYPQLTADGRTLVFAHAPTGRSATLWRATRSATDPATFDAPVELAELNPGGVHELNHPHVSLATREIFFSTTSLATGGMARNIFRAQLCLDGPCDDEEIVCPSPGIRSDDGLHCLRAGAAPDIWATARSACATLGAGWHLATFQSNEERAAMWTDFGRLGSFWIGASDVVTEGTWVWSNGEPWIHAGWGTIPGVPIPMQPDDSGGMEDCGSLWNVTVPAGGTNDWICSSTANYLCESELWPTW